MRYSQSVCLILCLFTLIWGCQSHNSGGKPIRTKPHRTSTPNPNEILVSLPDPMFIAANGSDSNGIIHITIRDEGSFSASGKTPYTMLTFCFVDSDKENDKPPRIYIGGTFPTEAGVRMLSAHESEMIIEALRTYLESNYIKDELASLLKEPELPIDSELRSEFPHCLIHILNQHKHLTK